MTMQANNFPGRDTDLSHLRFVLTGSFAAEPESSRPPQSNFRILLAGFLASLIFHFLLLFLLQPEPSAPKPTIKRMHITLAKPLKTLPVAPAEKIPTSDSTDMLDSTGEKEMPAERPVAEAATSNKPSVQVPTNVTDMRTKSSREEIRKPVISLTAEDIRELQELDNNEKAAQRRGSISENVFNPALRRRLQEEESKPVLQRADAGPKTHVDPSGATIVELGDGQCLRSSAPKAGEVQNWYMTACGGKSESERLMERVDQTVNGRLSFE